jgi:hypothetical protein
MQSFSLCASVWWPSSKFCKPWRRPSFFVACGVTVGASAPIVVSGVLDGAASPEATGAVVGPIPTGKTTMYSPGWAGEAAVIKVPSTCSAFAYPEA